MATMVYFDEIWGYDKQTRIFRTFDRDTLLVKSYENGIAVVDPGCGTEITAFAGLVAGCFEVGSNFELELWRAYEFENNVLVEDRTALTGIQFDFNGVTVSVTKENANAEQIVAEWSAGMDANSEKYRLEMEAYMKTPEYRAERAKALKLQTLRKTVQDEVLAIDESSELEFKNDEAKATWEQWVEINSHDDYSLVVVTYARRWAKYMQHLMTKHNKTINQIADSASYDTYIEGITGLMYGCAVVAMLSECWKYGEQLRRWFNKEWGQEDCDGVVNPAVLTINVG